MTVDNNHENCLPLDQVELPLDSILYGDNVFVLASPAATADPESRKATHRKSKERPRPPFVFGTRLSVPAPNVVGYFLAPAPAAIFFSAVALGRAREAILATTSAMLRPVSVLAST